MKRTIAYISGVALAMMFAACDDDFTRPPMVLPTTVDVVPTVTMEDFKTQFWGTLTSGPTTVGTTADGDSLVFTGRVCSSDASGNIFKNIVIQSHDEKGNQIALAFSVNSYDLYQLFPFGQEVAVYATGLEVGPYRNLLQAGSIDGDQMTFMSKDKLLAHVVRNKSALPEPAKVDTTVTDLARIDAIKSNSDSLLHWQSRLVRVRGVEWEDAGQQYAPGANTNRYVRDAQGHRLLVRNSSYADFADHVMPYGNGDVVGILSQFTSNLQLMLIDSLSCIGFSGIKPDQPSTPDPVQPSEGEVVYSSLGEDLSAIPEGWTVDNVTLAGVSEIWSWKIYENKGYLNASAFTTPTPTTEAYAVSPVIDLSGLKGASLSFDHAAKFQTTLRTLCGICIRPEGGKEWTKLEIPQWPDAGSWKFVSSGDIDLATYAGKRVQLAFKYGSDSTGADTWEIKNLSVKGNR